MEPNDLYGPEYFDKYNDFDMPYWENEAIETFLLKLSDYVMLLCKPETVLDVGCAAGFIVRRAREEFGIEAYGVDVSKYVLNHSVAKDFCFQHDISQPLPFLRKFDLVFCVEVLEHLEKKQAEKAVKNICAVAGKYIYFSSPPDDFEEETHINIHSKKYWIGQFSKNGFKHYDYLIKNPLEWGMLFINKDIA